MLTCCGTWLKCSGGGLPASLGGPIASAQYFLSAHSCGNRVVHLLVSARHSGTHMASRRRALRALDVTTALRGGVVGVG